MQRKKKLIVNLILIAVISSLIVAASLSIVGAIEIKETYDELVIEELKATCEHLDSEFGSMEDGADWSYENDTLIKGDNDEIAIEMQTVMDELHEETGIDYTIFWGDTRILTTILKMNSNERLIGTKASKEVIDTTLTNKQEYSSSSLNIEGRPYFGYYCPLKNQDGSVVGMVFCGRESADVKHSIMTAVLKMVGIAVGIIVVIIIIGIILAKKLSAIMKKIAEDLSTLASGNLSIQVQEDALARKDELGLIADSEKQLADTLSDIITKTKNMAENLKKAGTELAFSSNSATDASAQVSSAIDDISRGSVSQAESVQTAAQNTEQMGVSIDSVSEDVNGLHEAAEDMKGSCNSAMTAMGELISQSENVTQSVKKIGDVIQSTNDSANEISQFTETIQDIASQTNLLSLNASIEAARAGEMGKGFAVVAGEIGNLAKQSADSATQIKGIVDKLLSDAAASVSVMEELNQNFETQSDRLGTTKDNMSSMCDKVTDILNQAIYRLKHINLHEKR